MRETMHFERQRKIARQNVQRLAAEMVADRFIPGLQIYIGVLPTGEKLILNGNHTLEAIRECGRAQVVTITHRGVRDLDEAGAIYAVFDIQKARTWLDSIKAHRLGEGLKQPNKILPGLGIIQDGFVSTSGKLISRPERFQMIEPYRDAIDMYWSAIAHAPAQSTVLIQRAGIVCVALATLKYQPSLASEFWAQIARDNGLTEGMPERALLQWLRNTRDTAGHMARVLHTKAAALAWNAAFREEHRVILKPHSMSAFYLLGTPWAKGVTRD